MAAAYLVDTNILVRLTTFDVPTLARQARAMIEPLSDGNVELPLHVLAETVYVLAYNQNYQYSRSRIADSLRTITSINQLSLDVQVAGHALTSFKHTKLDFIDCLLLAQAKFTGQTVLSFDKKLLAKLPKP